MKSLLVLLLSILVLASSLIPCCPADNCQQETVLLAGSPATGTEQAATRAAVGDDKDAADQEHQDDQETSSCSPFFTCSGCSGFDPQLRLFSLLFLAPPSAVHAGIWKNAYQFHFSPSWFQPPRLA